MIESIAHTVAPLNDAVQRVLVEPVDKVLAMSIFGTETAQEIVRFCRDFASELLGSRVVDCMLFTQSVGAVFALTLEDRRRVVVKVHRRDSNLDELQAAYKIQHALQTKAFPCPRVLLPPQPYRGAIVAAQEYMVDGEFQDPHEPLIRRAMAEALAALVQRAKLFKNVHGLRPQVPPDRLLPRPHNILFNFEATAKGAGWIDEIAVAARAVLEKARTRTVLSHADWSAKNMRFADNETVVVYDWESLRVGDEMFLLGTAAVHFTFNHLPRNAGRDDRPTREESLAFVREYARARGRPLTDEQRERLSAGAAYALAYTARCEHARDPAGHDFEGSFREVLAKAKKLDYLE